MEGVDYSMNKLRSIINGIGFVVFLWFIDVIIAFGLFNRETPVQFVIGTWFIVDVSLYFYFKKRDFLNRVSNFAATGTVIVLIIFYFLPITLDFPQEALELNEEISDMGPDRYLYAKTLFFELEKRWEIETRDYMLSKQGVMCP